MYGSVLLARGRAQDAAALFSAQIDELSPSLPESLPMARALMLRANARRLLGEHARSAADSDKALQLFARVAGERVLPGVFHPFYNTRARSQVAQGDLVGAAETVARMPPASAPSADAVDALIVRARISLEKAEWQQARREAQSALAMLRTPQLLGRLPRTEAEALLVLGQARLHGDERADACVDLMQAASLRTIYDAPTSPNAAEVAHALEQCAP
jgi:serine/threonine-protein kinase